MEYLSVCSGIEAASAAWKDLGWEAVGFSEIEPFPSAVLKHHYPNVTNFGDMNNYKDWDINEPVDLIVGGSPCQSFSIAGLRKGLDDERGNLMLVYVRVLEHFKPKWFVWENVPGVLSSNGGKDFSAFLGALAELGYGFAYRVLDAKNFGVPQRRRRVFVVGYLGDWRPPAQVLFESESVCRDTQTCGNQGENTTANVGTGTQAYGMPGNWIGRKPENGGNATEPMYGIAPCLTKTDKHAVSYTDKKWVYRKLSLTAYVQDESTSTICSRDHKSVTDIVVYEHHPADSRVKDMGPTCSNGTARWGTGGGNTPLVAQPTPINTMVATRHIALGKGTGFGVGEAGDPAYTLTKGHCHAVHYTTMVRRLTPVECERLQGFPDDYTNIPWRKSDNSPDSLRYKAMGNSMAVPVMRWIGERVNYVDNKIVNET